MSPPHGCKIVHPERDRQASLCSEGAKAATPIGLFVSPPLSISRWKTSKEKRSAEANRAAVRQTSPHQVFWDSFYSTCVIYPCEAIDKNKRRRNYATKAIKNKNKNSRMHKRYNFQTKPLCRESKLSATLFHTSPYRGRVDEGASRASCFTFTLTMRQMVRVIGIRGADGLYSLISLSCLFFIGE